MMQDIPLVRITLTINSNDSPAQIKIETKTGLKKEGFTKDLGDYLNAIIDQHFAELEKSRIVN